MKSCPNCGAPLPGEDSRFCFGCGTDLAAPPPAPPMVAETPPVPQVTAEPVTPPSPQAFADAPGPSAQSTASLFTPAFAAEGGSSPVDFSTPRDALPTGKEAEELLRRALADSGPSLLADTPPVSAPPPAQTAGTADLFDQPPPAATIDEPPVDFPEAPPADLFAAEPVMDSAEAAPADLFAAEPVADSAEAPPADLFAAEPVAEEPSFSGDTAEFSLPGAEQAQQAPKQVFPTRQQATQQTIPFESQQNIESLFEENNGGARYNARQEQPQQAPRRPGDAPRDSRAAMVANIAQAAGADEHEESPRPMADGRSAPRPDAPTRRMPARAPQRTLEEDWPPPRKKKDKGRIVRNVLLIVLVFLVATFLATVGLLYFRNRPGAAIDNFAKAVTDRDYTALAEMTSLNDAPSTAEGWEAFCDAFEEKENMDALKAQLAQKPSSDGDVSGLAYEAVTLEGDTLFLFIKKHYVRITGVELLAPGAAEGTSLAIMGAEHSGAAVEGGVLYGKFMPGLYACRLTPPGGEAGAEIELEAFGVTEANRIEAAAAEEMADVTVENCLSDDAVLYINNNEVPQKPEGGVVQLQNVPLGAEIKIVAAKDGERSQSTVFFNSMDATALRFENYVPAEGGEGEEDGATKIASEATPEQMNQTLATFYASYLECINAQSLDGIKLSTEKNNQTLAGRITNPANSANTYSYVSASCKTDSISAGEENGVPSIKLNGMFEFSYTPRDGDEGAQRGSNYQSVHLLYIDNQWVVNGFVFVDDAGYNNNVIANF